MDRAPSLTRIFFLLFAGLEIVGDVKSAGIGRNFSLQLGSCQLQLVKILTSELDVDGIACRSPFQGGKLQPFQPGYFPDELAPLTDNRVG